MSSLLSNDFVEEFFRAERQLTKNEETFHIDREGKLIYTTPFETGNTIVDDRIINLDANHTPDNVNLIIDAISLFSTNPNIQNYLPLKFNFGTSEDSKPKIQFNSAESYTLTDYKVIVNPGVNLDTIQNRRYSSPVNTSVFDENGITKIKNLTQRKNEVYAFYDDEVQKVTYKICDDCNNVFDYNVVENVEPVTFSDGVLFTPSQIYSNNEHAIALVEQGGVKSFYNMRDDNHIIGSELDGDLVGIRLISTSLVVWDSFLDGTLKIFDKVDQGEYDLIYEDSGFFSNTPLKVSNYTSNLFLGYWLNNFSYVRLDNFNNFVTNWTNTQIQTFVGEVQEIYFGGSNIDEPIINVFSKSGNNIYWYRYLDFKLLSSGVEIIIKPIEFEVSDSFTLIKRYRNTVHFIDSRQRVVFCSLDTGKIILHTSVDVVPKIPLSISAVGDYGYLEGGLGQVQDDKIFFYTLWRNNRNIKNVYKVSYNYDERIFPYHRPDNFIFTISLPNNNPIADMEIFKYVIDYRIRYSKESLGKPQSTPVDAKKDDKKDAKKSSRPSDRSVGSVNRILGYVGDEFNVEDFLNIYSTR